MKTATRQTSNMGTRYSNKVRENGELKREIQLLKKAHAKDMRNASDQIGALQSMLHEVSAQLKQRENKHSFICTENNGYITSIVETQPYNTCVAFQELDGINLLEITKTVLYRKFPFLQINNGNIEINEEQYKKYKLGGII